eukprot:5508422-Amphidinium_carterae.1
MTTRPTAFQLWTAKAAKLPMVIRARLLGLTAMSMWLKHACQPLKYKQKRLLVGTADALKPV